MNWLVEQQIPVIVICLVVASISVVLFFNTRRPIFLIGVLVAGLLLGAGLWLESAVVTENEEIANTISAAAEAIEAGDVDLAMSYVDPSTDAWKIHGPLRVMMAARDFDNVSATIERIDITETSSPIRARARVFGKASGTTQGDGKGFNYIGRVEIWLYKDGDKWLIERVEQYTHNGDED